MFKYKKFILQMKKYHSLSHSISKVALFYFIYLFLITQLPNYRVFLFLSFFFPLPNAKSVEIF